MQFYVIGDKGQKYGPADVATLNQWAQQGRVDATTLLEDAMTGARMQASAVPGIAFGPDFRSATQGGGYHQGGYQQPGYQQPGAYPPGGFQQPGQQNPYAPGQYPRGGMYGMDDGSKDLTNAWIFGTLGLLQCCPVLFSSLGIYFAINATKKGNPKGQAAMYYCIATLVLGVGLGAFFGIASRFG